MTKVYKRSECVKLGPDAAPQDLYSKNPDDLEKGFKNGDGGHWVTIKKEGPLHGRHLFISDSGHILAGKGIPRHVVDHLNTAAGRTHLEGAEHHPKGVEPGGLGALSDAELYKRIGAEKRKIFERQEQEEGTTSARDKEAMYARHEQELSDFTKKHPLSLERQRREQASSVKRADNPTRRAFYEWAAKKLGWDGNLATYSPFLREKFGGRPEHEVENELWNEWQESKPPEPRSGMDHAKELAGKTDGKLSEFLRLLGEHPETKAAVKAYKEQTGKNLGVIHAELRGDPDPFEEYRRGQEAPQPEPEPAPTPEPEGPAPQDFDLWMRHEHGFTGKTPWSKFLRDRWEGEVTGSDEDYREGDVEDYLTDEFHDAWRSGWRPPQEPEPAPEPPKAPKPAPEPPKAPKPAKKTEKLDPFQPIKTRSNKIDSVVKAYAKHIMDLFHQARPGADYDHDEHITMNLGAVTDNAYNVARDAVENSDGFQKLYYKAYPRRSHWDWDEIKEDEDRMEEVHDLSDKLLHDAVDALKVEKSLQKSLQKSLELKRGNHALVIPRKVAPVAVEPTREGDLRRNSLTVYHSTPSRNVASIRQSGLIPRHGKPTQGENPAYNAVYFHTAKAPAEGFDVGEPKAVLRVRIPLNKETARRLRPDEDTFHKSAAEAIKAKSSIAYCGEIPPEWID